MKKQLVFFASIILVLSVLAGCGASNIDGNTTAETSSSDQEETTFERAKRTGTVTIGFANEKPYAYRTVDGEITGEAVEVARTILKNLGITEIKGELTEFGSLVQGLQAKRFDMITAGMYINPTRAEKVNFANPEYSIGEALAVKKGNPENLNSYEDIVANPEIKVGVMAGAAEIGYLEAMGAKKDQIVILPDQPSVISALQSGRVDAITMTGPSLQAMLDSAADDNLERVMDFEQPVIDGKSVRGYGATAFRKVDTDFLEAFNAELQKLKDSGELLEIISRFGFTEQELPGDITAEELSKPE